MQKEDIISEKRIKTLIVVFLLIALFLIVCLDDLMTHFLSFLDAKVAR